MRVDAVPRIAVVSEEHPYELVLTPPAVRAIQRACRKRSRLRVIEFVTGALITEPARVGKPCVRTLRGLRPPAPTASSIGSTTRVAKSSCCASTIVATSTAPDVSRDVGGQASRHPRQVSPERVVGRMILHEGDRPVPFERILGRSVGWRSAYPSGSGCDDARPGERQAEEPPLTKHVHLPRKWLRQDRLIGRVCEMPHTRGAGEARSQDRSA